MKKDFGFKFLLYSRIFRSVALIFMTLAAPIYLNSIHISITSIGIIYAGVMVFSAVLSISLGTFGDRHGYRKALILGEIPPLVGSMLLFATPNTAIVTLGVIIAGIGGIAGGMRGTFSPGMTALIARNYPDNNIRVRKFSVLVMAASVASIIGALVLVSQSYIQPYVGTVAAFRVLFGVAAVFIMVSLISLIFLEEAPTPVKSTKVMKGVSFRYMSKIVVLNAISGSALGISLPLLPLLFAIAFKLTEQTTALYIGIIYIPAYLATLLGSYLSRRYVKGTMMIRIASLTRFLNGAFLILLGVVFAMQYYGIMVFLPLLFLASLLYSCRSFISGFGSSSISTVSINGLDREDYGTATSVQNLALNFAQTSSGLSGYLIEAALPLPLFVGGLIQMFGGLLYPILLKNKQQK